MKKTDILWVSLMAPYDNVGHASGKTQNFYLKKLHDKKEYNIYLISFANCNIKEKVDLDKYNIKNKIFYYTWDGKAGRTMKWRSRFSKVNIWNRNAGLISPYYAECALKQMIQMKEKGYEPQIIIFQWTEIALMLEKAKKIFPNAKTVIIEEDVSFLGHERKAEAESGIKKRFLRKKALRIKKREIELLNKSDLIILNNEKDRDLIYNEIYDTNKIMVWCPYFQNMLPYKRKESNKNIIFFGAISRPENWKSIVWFIENVWPLIKDEEIHFIIIGSDPPDVLKKYESDRIQITGFVENIKPYFEESMCLVVPLVLGAGVKVKVLEGLSAGIPVLTNTIGIEGIPVRDKEDFFFCETPNAYVDIIESLCTHKIDTNSIEKNSKEFISHKFNYENDVNKFQDRLKQLL